MRILVTGGLGFIGSHLVDRLVADGHDVAVLDSLAPHVHATAPAYANPAATYVEGDVRDPDAWRQVLPGVDAVSHQAARVGLGVSPADVRGYVEDNDVGTAVGLWCLHEAGFAGRLVLASSMVVYGEGAYRCAEHGPVRPGPRRREALDAGDFEPPCPTCGRRLEPALVDEDAPLDPRNTYAATKLHQEHLAAVFGRETGVPVIALRYHNVYGPRMPRDTPYAGVAAIFRSALERGEAPQVFEDGGQRRDFVHVADVAAANVAALTQAEPLVGACNVASGHPHTVGDLAHALAAAMGGPTPVTTGAYRLGDVRHVTASPARAAEQLGFRAAIPFADGVTEFATAALRDA
ncbi:NAD-dependent epimerase/dehydratase family protein [Aquihabitans sp. G128]|uniref:NAD-dependent epimerase/dehydratase family protein n=1 Tax=Aquihabitans sp. G128 TaxID=2849779 RepID=UPI001C241008|nr:NAD-dependent epimerase/dehydratase family protein [Aquihabitans sp. G128]QXC59648.1 NAD-dependent epimerase/dehydratase family protein [Aquihabitans sp. G128]